MRLHARNHHQPLRLAAQPDIPQTVLADTPYFSRIQVHTVQTTFHAYQFPTAFPQEEEAGTTRADIDIAGVILMRTTHHDIRTTKSRQVDVGSHHFAVMIPADAMQTYN